MNIDGLYLCGRKPMFLDQNGHGFSRSLDGRADAEFLDVGDGNLVVTAQIINPFGQLIPSGAKDVEKVAGARKNILLAGKAILGE